MLERLSFGKYRYVSGPKAPVRPATRRATYAGAGAVVTVAKTKPVRSEAYRRRVAALPCIRCGIGGYSQAAHGPALGRGIKASDKGCFPLCCDRPGIVGCHSLYDGYKLGDVFYRYGFAAEWAEKTRKRLSK